MSYFPILLISRAHSPAFRVLDEITILLENGEHDGLLLLEPYRGEVQRPNDTSICVVDHQLISHWQTADMAVFM